MQPGEINSGITFFYYSDLSIARSFYEETLNFKIIDDQGWAIIYQVSGSYFFGIVNEDKGFCEPQDSNAVLLTLVVDDAAEWYQYLADEGVSLESELEVKEDIGVKVFFFRDPVGYAIEVQEFTDPEKKDQFKFPATQ